MLRLFFALASAVIILESCVSHSRHEIALEAVANILTNDTTQIETFLHLKAGESVRTVDCWADGDLNIVLFDKDSQKAVVCRLGQAPYTNGFSVDNCGFGEHDTDGWGFYHTNHMGEPVFEFNGGIGSLKELIRAVETATTRRTLTNVQWVAKSPANSKY